MKFKLNKDKSARVLLDLDDVEELMNGTVKITVFGGSKGITLSQSLRIKRPEDEAEEAEIELYLKNKMLQQVPLRARINNLIAKKEWGEPQ